jgi:hypothetical protein
MSTLKSNTVTALTTNGDLTITGNGTGKINLTGAAVAAIVSLTDGTNVAVNFSDGQNFSLTLAGNRTLENPTNCVAGQSGSIFVIQDGTGSRTLSYGANWKFSGGTAPTLTTTAAAIDRIDYIVQTATAVQAILTPDVK